MDGDGDCRSEGSIHDGQRKREETLLHTERRNREEKTKRALDPFTSLYRLILSLLFLSPVCLYETIHEGETKRSRHQFDPEGF